MQNQQQSHSSQPQQNICTLISGDIIKCQKCQKLFNSRSHLYRHNREQHEETIKTFSCTQCSKTFKRQSHLKRHMISHTHEKSFICGYTNCGMKFGYKHHLQRHIKIIHSSQLAFKCSECGESFKKKKQLNKHLQNCSKTSEKVVMVKTKKIAKNKKSKDPRQKIDSKSNMRVYRCKYPNCLSVFFKNYALKRHFKKVHHQEAKSEKQTFNVVSMKAEGKPETN